MRGGAQAQQRHPSGACHISMVAVSAVTVVLVLAKALVDHAEVARRPTGRQLTTVRLRSNNRKPLIQQVTFMNPSKP